jgi:predicted nucleic acid-binding protein
VQLAADANVLLSAVLGGRAKAVLTHPSIENVFTTKATLSEVNEYALVLARKKQIPAGTVILAVATLPVTLVESRKYSGSIARAKQLIGKRDPDDVQLLALALHLGIPVWSNDNDFEGTGVDWFTTAQLLRIFGVGRP